MRGLHKLLLLHVLTCLGQNGHGGEIINGDKVPENSMLYMVSVQNNRGHVCGGFLVREDFVITAAHCDKEELRVVLGTHNLKKPGQTRTIQQKYKPKTYVSVSQGDDIMLLKLSSTVQLDDSIKTIQLPDSEINIEEIQQCRVAGWGYTNNNLKVTDELMMVNVSVIKPEVCKGKWIGLSSKVICAGGMETNKGTCQGDSGGPLVCNDVAVGIVSFNRIEGCDYPDLPNVYTDVSKYLQWINDILNPSKHKE